jgi:hypothetical protein
MTVFVNLFQNLGSGYMKLLPEFQIESISAIEEKKRDDQISLYLRKTQATPLCEMEVFKLYEKYLPVNRIRS